MKNITIDYKINTEERRDISRRRFDVVAEKRITSDVRMESITITIDMAMITLVKPKGKGCDRPLAHDFDNGF